MILAVFGGHHFICNSFSPDLLSICIGSEPKDAKRKKE